MTYILEMKNVTKNIKSRHIYSNINYSFETGCYAITGHNGVGKTVLLEMLSGVEPESSGSIILSNVGSSRSLKFKENLVYVPSKATFFPSVTGNEFLDFIASVKSHTKNYKKELEYMISGFKLTNHLNTRFNNMSLGTQKKLFLSTMALGNNKVIILDEPTNGLDHDSQMFLCKILKNLLKEAIIIYATHDQKLLNDIPHKLIHLKEPPTEYLITINFLETQYAKTVV